MADRYDLLTARENNGKTYFTKIGAMFANRNGDGFTISLDALPIAGPDGCKIIVKVPQQRDSQPVRQQQRSTPATASDLDDDVPF